MRLTRLWIAFGLVLALSFAVLGWAGLRIYQEAPPVPVRVVSTDGAEVIGPGEIHRGQNVWQSLGGMEVGSIWGHGSYVAPDWTADWLHREAMFVLDEWSRESAGKPWSELDPPRQAALQQRLADAIRQNRYDPATGTLTIEPVRARAFAANAAHFADVFANGRDAYAIPPGTLREPADLRALASFFFWTSWAATTPRPGDRVTYTSNWPHEPLVGNRPSGDLLIWTGISVLLLLAGVGAMAAMHAAQHEPEPVEAPVVDPLLDAVPTPSQRATTKYFWTVAALLVVQIGLGVVVAHYGVEGGGFYGIPLASVLPYSIARTWHLQLGIFWIATAWLASGLYVAPAVGGREPAGQRLGVDVLFGALLVVVVGSLVGQWLSVFQHLGHGGAWFWFGHSGYEYIDLGRFWQIALLVGLFLWLGLMLRGLWPALVRPSGERPLLLLFVVSIVAIAGFYAAALGYGRTTNLAIAEYWRWWVVHLWVEGFFEVFATVVIAFLFARLGLIAAAAAGAASIASATIFLAGGVIGTLHHLYFSGTPVAVLALGSTFSALEVVPLLFVGFEAWRTLRLGEVRPWVERYRWPIRFFVAVAFWNLVGAGLFGFMINPPIALYFMQGLNTTPVHGHAALFGVYGVLGLGLTLFCLRNLVSDAVWPDRLIAFSFWAINVGLFLMVVGSLLPVGLLQTWAAVEHGYWYARSAEFLQTPTMEVLRWLRVPGDLLFAAGATAFAFVVTRIALWHRGSPAPSTERGDRLAARPDEPARRPV